MRPRRRPAERPLPEIDPCMGDPTARLFCDALTDRDWPTARGILVRTDHPDDRAFLLETCGSVVDVQNWIEPVAADDPLAQLVRGCHAVAWAWQARGGHRAPSTQADQFRVFFERLRIAESCLYDVVSRDPGEVAAWAFLIRTARGLELPLADGEFRFRQVIERHQTHLKAHEEWMQTRCAKWAGSEEWMHQFARDAAARGGDGSMLYFNTFALAFSASGDLPAAAAVFEQIGDNITAYPWGYLPGDPAKSFATARATVLG